MGKAELNPHEAFDRFKDPEIAGEVFSLAMEGEVSDWKEAERKAKLFVAVKSGDARKIRRLVANGISPNTRRRGQSLLYFALFTGKPRACATLLRLGANPNLDKAFPPLGHSAMGDLESSKLLIKFGANVNANGDCALFNACETGQQKIAALLIAHGANIEAITSIVIENKKRVNRVRPLMVAAWQGHAEIVKLLLSSNANQDAKDSNGSTALDWAKRCPDSRQQARVVCLLNDKQQA